MGMKHASDYYDDWQYGEEMFYKHPWVKYDTQFCHTRLISCNLVVDGLFCFPSDYMLWLNSMRKNPLRHCWPICYLVALNDVIPIHICSEPHVALQDPAEVEYVWNTHKDILSIVLQIIRDNWKDVLLHHLGYIEDLKIHKILNDRTWHGAMYDSHFLEKHPPVKANPHHIYILEEGKCVKKIISNQ